MQKLFQFVLPKLRVHEADGSFELLGLDFMIDEQLKVYLVEVNTSPALFRKGKYLKELLPPLIEEVLQKTLDVSSKPPLNYQYPPPHSNLSTFEQLKI